MYFLTKNISINIPIQIPINPIKKVYPSCTYEKLIHQNVKKKRIGNTG